MKEKETKQLWATSTEIPGYVVRFLVENVFMALIDGVKMDDIAWQICLSATQLKCEFEKKPCPILLEVDNSKNLGFKFTPKGDFLIGLLKGTLNKVATSDNREMNDWKKSIPFNSKIFVLKRGDQVKYQVQVPKANGRGSFVAREYYF
mgnify:CR=1 FL=1